MTTAHLLTGAPADGASATLGLLVAAAAVVLTLLAVVVRLDPAGLLLRRRQEQYIRRATDALVQEAHRAQREHMG